MNEANSEMEYEYQYVWVHFVTQACFAELLVILKFTWPT